MNRFLSVDFHIIVFLAVVFGFVISVIYNNLGAFFLALSFAFFVGLGKFLMWIFRRDDKS